MARFGSTPQNDRVAGFDAKHGGVAGHVGTRFVNDANHADGSTDFGDAQPVRPGPLGDDLPGRILQADHLADAVSHAGDALRGKAQTINGRLVQAAGGGGLHILAVRFQNRAGADF